MNDDSKYRNLPDFEFRSQYDVTPRPDADVEAALRREMDSPKEQATARRRGVDVGVVIPEGFHRIG